MPLLLTSGVSSGAMLAVLGLDVNGFLVSNDFATLLANFFTAIFSGIANLFLGGLFSG